MSRVLLVSNRLPINFQNGPNGLEVARSHGGLATGLRGPHERSKGLWIGWPGDVSCLTPHQRADFEKQLAGQHVVPVYLSQEEVEGFYEGFSNRVLWPLFHYLLDHIPLRAMEWQVYQRVNQRFADAVAKVWREGDLIWIHDYHLCLVPGMLREKLPQARIGYFLHIPFPSSEVVQALPWRNQLLKGLLGADLIGFHTYPYVRHFSNALLRLLGVPADVDRVSYEGRVVRFGAYPMGIDAETFDQNARSPEVEQWASALRDEANGQKLLLSVDRLDYTKGIRRRLLAVDRLLTREPSLKGRLKLIQIAVPSRTGIDDYAEFTSEVEEVVGRVNGLHSTTSWSPVQYLYRGFSQRELSAFYRATDVMLVTPLRDGMNLVAKEFCASRPDERGVLLLSELAGASAELGEALLVNPYDIDGMGEAILRGLSMSEREQSIRMRALRRRVMTADVHQWVATFMEDLERAGVRAEVKESPRPSSAEVVAAARLRVSGANKRVFLLDCDGTLLGIERVPALVGPDREVCELLSDLAALPNTQVHVVSGRPRDQLEAWFGALPIAMHAEHGVWTRATPELPWVAFREGAYEWREKVKCILDSYVARTPGSFVEEKSAALVWHYRMADPEFGLIQAKELLIHLREGFSNAPVEILSGDKVIEVRPHGINKGVIVAPAMAAAGPGALLVAMGDDATDEDLFAALPKDGLAVHVGAKPSRAPVRLPSVKAARKFLREIVEAVRAREDVLDASL